MANIELDWKAVSNTSGYRTLKDALIKDIQKNYRSRREELYKEFYRIIGLAQHHAFVHDCSISEILDDWESQRKGWWFGHYRNGIQFHKRHSNSLKPMGLKGMRAYYKRLWPEKTQLGMRRERMKTQIQYRQIRTSKDRWSANRKKFENEIRKSVT